MEPEELEEIRIALVARREELIAEGDIAIEPKKDEADHKPDDDEAPLSEMNQVIASKRNKARAMELQKIENALKRIAVNPDDFGLCLDCDEPINPKRLEVMPWALRCVECADSRGPKRGGRRRHLADFD